MGNEDGVRIHHGVLFSHEGEENHVMSGTGMELEIITLSKISQAQKDKCHIFPLISRIYKKTKIKDDLNVEGRLLVKRKWVRGRRAGG